MEEGQAASGMGGGRATEEAMAAMEEAKSARAARAAAKVAQEMAEAVRVLAMATAAEKDRAGLAIP